MDDRVLDCCAAGIVVQPAGDQPRRQQCDVLDGQCRGHDAQSRQPRRGADDPVDLRGFHQAGTSTNIYDPVANLCAARNYLLFDPKYRVSADGSDLGRVAQFQSAFGCTRVLNMSVEAFVRAAGGDGQGA